MSDTDILFERRGALGLITLNRPQAMNALTHDMALRLERQLDLWRDDDAVAVVAIRGAGEKAFCAGGDIRVLYEAGKEDGSANFPFYADEYRLNVKIKRYPKPYVAFMDGVVMGGGVGVSIHGACRIATERTLFAMPETGIGLFPDVGGTWFLPRLPGELGLWLGLTGTRIKGKDAVAVGVCDAFVASDQIDKQIEQLAEGGWRALGDGRQMAESGLDVSSDGFPLQQEVDRHFGGDSLEAVLENLRRSETEWGAKQREIILSKSPYCTRLAFRQIREGAKLDFEDCMRLEYRLARACMTHGDFFEGVRALIIDKDNAPKWSPSTLDAVTDAMVDAAFSDLGDEELAL